MTGLSDIGDILGDLLAGGVSASELGLTPAQAEKLSRYECGCFVSWQPSDRLTTIVQCCL